MPVKVHVNNFQSIQEASIEIDHFTVITGANNTGKTAIQRAVRGVFQNTPGTAFVREGETSCAVTLEFSDHTVTWSKGTGKRDRPTYILDGGAPIYPGQGVPDEVAALGVAPITAGGQEIWPTIAPQFTGQIFLLDKPGPVIAEAVADVERVGWLNRGFSRAETDRRSASSQLRVRQSDLINYEAEVSKYEGLDKVVAAVEAIEASRVQIQRIDRGLQNLEALRTRLLSATKVVKQLTPVAEMVPPDSKSASQIRKDLVDLQKMQTRLQALRREVTRLQDVGQVKATADEGEARRLRAARDVLVSLRDNLLSAQSKLAALQTEIVAAEKTATEAGCEVDSLFKEFGSCPLCQRAT